MVQSFRWADPDTVEEASALLRAPDGGARAYAGGIALIVLLRQGLIAPDLLVHLGRIPGLSAIRIEPDASLVIGALATHAAVAASPLVRARIPALAMVEDEVASAQVRTVGTLGGNLCHADPASDPPPVLLALDAAVRVQNGAAPRDIPLTAFFHDYYETVLDVGDVLTAICVPPLPPRSGVRYVRLARKQGVDFPVAAVAARVTLDGQGVCREARIALAALGPTPRRAEEAERLLVGADRPEAIGDAADRVARAAEPVDDVRASAAYRRRIAPVLARRALEGAWTEARASRP